MIKVKYVTASIVSRKAIWIRNFINDFSINGLHFYYVKLRIDNQAAEGLTRNSILYNRAKYIDIYYHFVRKQVLQHKDIIVYRVSTKDNLVDILIKSLTEDIFRYLLGQLGLKRLTELRASGES